MTDYYISIVVPVYNVEKYIRFCIDSILRQEYGNFELILVDDGSTDSSGTICDFYAEKDKRIKVIHKDNRGLSDARNVGIDTAVGDFITFIDSDDCIDEKYLKILIEASQSSGADIIQGDMCRNAKLLGNGNADVISTYDAKSALISLLLFDEVKVYACGKLYKSSLFNNIRYPVGRINEDCCTTYKLLLKCQKVACIPMQLYYYRQTPNSILNRSFSMERMKLLEVPDEIEFYLGEKASIYRNYLEYYRFRVEINLINESVRCKQGEVSKFREIVFRKIKTTMVDTKMLNFKYRCIYHMARNNPQLYVFIVNMLRKRILIW